MYFIYFSLLFFSFGVHSSGFIGHESEQAQSINALFIGRVDDAMTDAQTHNQAIHIVMGAHPLEHHVQASQNNQILRVFLSGLHDDVDLVCLPTIKNDLWYLADFNATETWTTCSQHFNGQVDHIYFDFSTLKFAHLNLDSFKILLDLLKPGGKFWMLNTELVSDVLIHNYSQSDDFRRDVKGEYPDIGVCVQAELNERTMVTPDADMYEYQLEILNRIGFFDNKHPIVQGSCFTDTPHMLNDCFLRCCIPNFAEHFQITRDVDRAQYPLRGSRWDRDEQPFKALILHKKPS